MCMWLSVCTNTAPPCSGAPRAEARSAGARRTSHRLTGSPPTVTGTSWGETAARLCVHVTAPAALTGRPPAQAIGMPPHPRRGLPRSAHPPSHYRESITSTPAVQGAGAGRGRVGVLRFLRFCPRFGVTPLSPSSLSPGTVARGARPLGAVALSTCGVVPQESG